VREWVRPADLDAGVRSDGLTTADREERARLRRENRRLPEDVEILKRARLLRDGDPVNVYPFIEAEKSEQRTVARACVQLTRWVGLAAAPYDAGDRYRVAMTVAMDAVSARRRVAEALAADRWEAVVDLVAAHHSSTLSAIARALHDEDTVNHDRPGHVCQEHTVQCR
jgi:hypothetical protein